MEKLENGAICSRVLSSAFGRGPSGPSSAVWLIVQHYMSKMQLLWEKYVSVLSYCRDEPGNTPGHNCIFLPWAVVCTMCICWYQGYGPGDGQGEGRGRKNWTIRTRSYMASTYGFVILGVDDVQYESSVFFLYPDWWLNVKKWQNKEFE